MESKKLFEISNLLPNFQFRSALQTDPSGRLQLVQLKDLDALDGVNWGAVVRIPDGFGRGPAGIEVGDLLLAKRGLRFPCSVVETSEADVAVSPYIFHLRPNRAVVNPIFLSWFFNFGPGQAYLESNADGAFAGTVRNEVLLDCPVTLPPLAVQEALAQVVSAVAEQNRRCRQLLATNDELLRAMPALLAPAREG